MSSSASTVEMELPIVDKVKIERRADKGFEAIYDLSILDKAHGPEFVRIENCMNSVPRSMSFLVGLANTFRNRFIRSMELHSFTLEDEELHGVEEAVGEANMQIETVSLFYTTIGSDQAFRFLAALRPKRVFIARMEDPTSLRLLRTETFFNFMSTLQCIHIFANRALGPPSMEIPHQMEKYPKDFVTSDVFLLPLSTVVTGIQRWCESEEVFGTWNVSIRQDVCRDVHQFAESVGRPYTVETGDCGQTIEITNCGKKKLRAYAMDDSWGNGHVTEFIITGVVIRRF